MTICAREACRRRQSPLVGRRLAGVTIDGDWFCSTGCAEEIVRERILGAAAPSSAPERSLPVKLGAWLCHNGVLSPAGLARALEAQRASGLKLGAQVRALGLASSDAVLRALAQQAGLPYLTRVDRAVVRRGPGGLAREAVRALGLVPFCEPAGGAIKVACAAPVPRLAIAALRHMTGLVPQAHLVGDEEIGDLLTGYAADAIAVAPPRSRDLSEAVQSVAALAAASPSVRLSATRCEAYTWVRVTSPDSAHDMLFAASEAM